MVSSIFVLLFCRSDLISGKDNQDNLKIRNLGTLLKILWELTRTRSILCSYGWNLKYIQSKFYLKYIIFTFPGDTWHISSQWSQTPSFPHGQSLKSQNNLFKKCLGTKNGPLVVGKPGTSQNGSTRLLDNWSAKTPSPDPQMIPTVGFCLRSANLRMVSASRSTSS